MLEERRTGHMSDQKRAASLHSKYEWKRVMESLIKSERSRVKSETTRTRGSKRRGELSLREENELKQKKKRNNLQEYVLNNVSMVADVVPDGDLVDHVVVVVVDDDDDDECRYI